MEFLGNFKQKAGNYILAKRLKQVSRQRQASNFSTAQTAGILFTPYDPASFEEIKHFLTYLNQYKLQIYVLGYVDAKEIPESFLFWKGINLFSKKELKWTHIPHTEMIDDFIGKPFDILFDLSMKNYFPVEFITRLSRAKFKIGRYTGEHEAYDLMFEIGNETTLKEYLENINNYLGFIG